MSKLIAILVVALLLEGTGVVLLSSGLKQIGEPERFTLAEIGRTIQRGATNGRILLGVLFEAIFFGALLYLLSKHDVSLIWPLTSLGFVVTTLAAKFLLHEQVSATRWSGVVLIVIGAWLVSWSTKETKPGVPIVTAGESHKQ